MGSKIFLDLDLLKKLYCEKNIIIKDIAKQFNCDQRVVIKKIKEENLLRNYQNPSWLKDMHYEKKLTLGEMSKQANCNPHSITKYMRKHNLKVLDEVTYRNVTKYKVDKDYFSVIDSSEKAYWLGYIVADASISYEKCDTYRLDFTISKKDETHLQLFKKAINSNHPILNKKTLLHATGKAYSTIQYRVNNSHLCKSLISLGVLSNKSGKEIFPNIDQRFYKDFILGVFDGDGCFSHWFDKKQNIYIAHVTIVGGPILLNKISEILKLNFNITANVKPDGNIYRITVSNSNASLFMNWLYKDTNLYLKRKYEKFLEWNYLDELNFLCYNF